jgi:hypothetical protein
MLVFYVHRDGDAREYAAAADMRVATQYLGGERTGSRRKCHNILI